MVFVTPKTWASGELVTHTMLNTELKAQLIETQARVLALESTVGTHTTTLGTLTSAWTTYTPALTAATTNPTLGTGGTILGGYKANGKTIFGHMEVVFGTGMTPGSGIYYVSLPTTPKAGTDKVIGNGFIWDASTSTMKLLGLRMVGASDRVYMYFDATTSFTVTHAVPWTWAVSDQFSANFVYETA